MKRTAEEQMKVLFSKHSLPPLEVIIPVLEKSGRGEQELTTQVYDITTSLAKGIKEILGLKDKSMQTLAKVEELLLGTYGVKFEPIELSDFKFSYSITDCPMVHVGKGVSHDVKSKFCDLICTSAAKALLDTLLGSQRGNLTWDKALIKGAGKCTITFESAKDR